VRHRREILALAILLAVAAVLRLYRLGEELWFDEIVTQIRVASFDLRGIATTYESQNQHLLYSLLARLSIDALGDTPAALRLPAAAFGVLSVWAVYLLGRDLLSRREGALAALLLTVSDVHVWFSQNARGYTALLLATLLSSRLLLRALDGDRLRTWLAYAVVGALGLWVHLTMLFVLAGHAVLIARRRVVGVRRTTLQARLAGPLAGIGGALVLALLLYAPVVPALLAVNATEGRDGGVAEWSSSRWAVGEVLRVLGDAFVQPPLALGAVALGVLGTIDLWRRRSILLELLAWPVVVGVAVVLGSGHTVWPRLFFFAIGFAALIVVHGATLLGAALAHRTTRVALRPALALLPAVLVIAVAGAALPDAYGPKQRHAEAIALVEAMRGPGDLVAIAGPAARVARAYFGRDWLRIESAAELESARRGAHRTFFVHAFPIQLRGRRPDVAHALERDFRPVARFAGTLGGGDVLVWASEHAPGPASGASVEGFPLPAR